MLDEIQSSIIKEKNDLFLFGESGTGKTETILRKIVNLVKKKQIPEQEILLLTTNKLAKLELKNTLRFKFEIKNIQINDIQTFNISLLEKFQKFVPHFDKNFQIISKDMQFDLLKSILIDVELHTIEIKNNLNEITLEFLELITMLKQEGFHLSKFDKLIIKDLNFKTDLFLIFSEYEKKKLNKNLLDFEDIAIYLNQLFEKKPDLINEIFQDLSYVFFDGVQDLTNSQLNLLLKFIINKNNLINSAITFIISLNKNFQKNNIFSEIRFKTNFFHKIDENFLSKKLPIFKIYNLKNQFRNSKTISDLITNFQDFNLKKISKNNEINLFEVVSKEDQIKLLLLKVKKFITKNSREKLLIFCRDGSTLRFIAEYLNFYKIKFNSEETQNFFQSSEIKFITSIFEIIAKPNESNEFFFYFLNHLNFRKETIAKIMRKSSLREKSVFKVFEFEKTLSNFEKENAKLIQIKDKVDKLITQFNTTKNIFYLTKQIIDDFGIYKKLFILEDSITIQNLNNFIKFVEEYSIKYKKNNLEDFLKLVETNTNNNFYLNYIYENFNLGEVEDIPIHLKTHKMILDEEYDYLIIPEFTNDIYPLKNKKHYLNLSYYVDLKEFNSIEEKLFKLILTKIKKNIDLITISSKEISPLNQFLNLELIKINSTTLLEEFNENFNFKEKNKQKTISIKKIVSAIMGNDFQLAKNELEKLEISKKNLELIKNSNKNIFLKYENKPTNSADKTNLEENELEFHDFSKHIYSVSQIKTFDQCPKKYLYQYIYKIPTKPKHYFDFGTSIHSVLENIVDSLDLSCQIDIEYTKAIALLHRVWISKGYLNSKQEREYFEKGLEIIKKFISKELNLRKENKNRKIIGKELDFTIDVEGKKLYGIIDRVEKINEDYIILDYKTSNSKEPQYLLDKSIQLYVYAMAVKELFGEFPKELGLWYLNFDEISTIKFSKSNLGIVKNKILDIIKRIEKKDFQPNPSSFNCKFCDFSRICQSSFK